MPIYDRRCNSCGWQREDCYETSAHYEPCPTCGEPTERLWTSRPAAVHGDDYWVGGRVYENLGHEPVVIHSRSELKREMDKRGLREYVRHVGEPGGDRSTKTSRWI